MTAYTALYNTIKRYTNLYRPIRHYTGTGTGTHKLYWHVTHLQSKLRKQYLKDL